MYFEALHTDVRELLLRTVVCGLPRMADTVLLLFLPFTVSEAIENLSLHAPLGVLGKGHGHYVPQSYVGGPALKHSLKLPGL